MGLWLSRLPLQRQRRVTVLYRRHFVLVLELALERTDGAETCFFGNGKNGVVGLL